MSIMVRMGCEKMRVDEIEMLVKLNVTGGEEGEKSGDPFERCGKSPCLDAQTSCRGKSEI